MLSCNSTLGFFSIVFIVKFFVLIVSDALVSLEKGDSETTLRPYGPERGLASLVTGKQQQ